MSGKSELKIFDDHPPQVVVDSGYFESIHPRGSLENDNSIEFYIPASNVDYLDLNDTLLSMQIKVVKADGTNIKSADISPLPSTFLMHALFSDITLSLNDTVIEGGASLYPYKACIDSLLNLAAEARDSQLLCIGYSSDENVRHGWLKESKSYELAGVLRLDFFNQPKYLIPGVNVRLMMTRASADFVLGTKKGDTAQNDGTWKIVIDKAILYARRVKVHPTVLKAHTIGLETKNALYPYTTSKVVTCSVAQGSSSFFKDNLFSSSVLPKVVIVGLVLSSALTGSLKHCPLEFKHYGVTKVDLLLNGQSIPYRSGYSCDLANHQSDMYVRSILQNMNLLNTNHSSALSFDRFQDGQTFFVFNLTPDFDMRERQPIKDANLRLDLQFKPALTDALNVIAFACYDTTLQITNNGIIIKDPFA